MDSPLPQPQRSVAWLVAASCLAVLLPLSWRHWASPFVDFGRELYVAWQLSEGAALHADVAWFNGPLAPWVNSALFTVCGDSLLVLVAWNLGLLLGLMVLLVLLVEALFDRASAVLAAAVIPVVFGLAQALKIGNYNFLTPYSHDLTQGVLLAVGALYAAWRGRSGAWTWSLLAGAAVGAAFLTKPETFLAALGGWFACTACTGAGLPFVRRIQRGLGGLGAGLLVVTLAYVRLHSQLGSPAALSALAGAWPYALDSRVRDMPFYGQITGLAHPQIYAEAMLQACGRYAVLFAAGTLLLFAWKRDPSARMQTGVVFGVGLGMHLLWFAWAPWMSLARPLPIVVAAVLLGSTFRVVKPGRDSSVDQDQSRDRAALRVAFAVLAAGLLAKTPLNTRWAHYGFALALPGTLLALGLSVGDLPRFIARRRADLAAPARALAAGFWVVVACSLVFRSVAGWRAETSAVGSEADSIYATPELGVPLQSAFDWLQPRLEPGETLLVMPEGVMLNFQLRVPSPTRYVNFMPPELLFWGENNILAALQAADPDYVVLVHKDTSEYGFPAFGADYGQSLYAWVRSAYTPSATFGAVPFTSPAFGVAIYTR